jgi:hypothetical protein
MHFAAIGLAFVALCVLAVRVFKRCARSQRAALLDAPPSRRIVYQPLPTTIA